MTRESTVWPEESVPSPSHFPLSMLLTFHVLQCVHDHYYTSYHITNLIQKQQDLRPQQGYNSFLAAEGEQAITSLQLLAGFFSHQLYAYGRTHFTPLPGNPGGIHVNSLLVLVENFIKIIPESQLEIAPKIKAVAIEDANVSEFKRMTTQLTCKPDKLIKQALQ